ncbi:hypothetical protein ABH922_003003 [Rhodococcus sp. 27YEA15]
MPSLRDQLFYVNVLIERAERMGNSDAVERLRIHRDLLHMQTDTQEDH